MWHAPSTEARIAKLQQGISRGFEKEANDWVSNATIPRICYRTPGECTTQSILCSEHVMRCRARMSLSVERVYGMLAENSASLHHHHHLFLMN
ncbi:hypothetical protein E2C01_084721 [Portunus trituberculatus]|uniref:Uncharacterized protein n=1 Tax=Portunus trituberculatus TaxID=210409 RepID=A0A5B7J0R3_PORTR|nr:hypothetical protein [Portunus trituberculatus]